MLHLATRFPTQDACTPPSPRASPQAAAARAGLLGHGPFFLHGAGRHLCNGSHAVLPRAANASRQRRIWRSGSHRPRRRSDGTPHRRPRSRPRLWWKASPWWKKLLMLLLGLLLALLLFWGFISLPWAALPSPAAGCARRPPLNPQPAVQPADPGPVRSGFDGFARRTRSLAPSGPEARRSLPAPRAASRPRNPKWKRPPSRPRIWAICSAI